MRRRIIPIIIIILVLGLYAFLNSSLFVVGSLEWEGVNILDIGQLNEWTSFKSQNVFQIEHNLLATTIEENNWVKSANVKWRWPNRLVIQIKERVPLAMVPISENYLILDAEGLLLPPNEGLSVVALPLITNVAVNDQEVFRTIARILAHVPASLFESISEWNATEQTLILRNGIQIYLGDLRNLDQKFATLEMILLDLEVRNRAVKRIDLRILNSPVIIE